MLKQNEEVKHKVESAVTEQESPFENEKVRHVSLVLLFYCSAVLLLTEPVSLRHARDAT